MKKYEQYKDSGVQWIGLIPSHWQMTKSKHIFSLITDNVHDKSLPKVALENIESGTGKYIETSSDFMGEGIEFQVNDILFGKLRPYLAKVYKADFRGQSVGDIYVFRARENQDAGFLKYLMLSRPFISVVDGSTHGAKMPRANWDFISQMLLPTPYLDEQKIIAAYLDHKVSQIDALIAEKERMVEDLQAYRSAIISESVTRGLDKSAQMRDSCIDWIGQIPEHWSVCRVKDIFSIINGNGFSLEFQGQDKGDYPFCKASDINGSEMFLSSAKNFVDKALVVSERYNIIPPYSILFSKIGEALKKNHRKINTVPCIVDNNCSALVNRSSNDINYLYYVMKIVDMFWFDNDGVIPCVNTQKLLVFNLPIPPKEEQQAISIFLNNKTKLIDNLISTMQAEITDLLEYKSSVITEAVTGKVDLRDWKPKTVTA